MAKLTTLKPRIAAMQAGRVQSAATPRDRGSRWRRIRQQVLDRAGWVCQCSDCASMGRVRPATEVDHILPLADGGTDEVGNLQAINRECHARKTVAENGKNWRGGG